MATASSSRSPMAVDSASAVDSPGSSDEELDETPPEFYDPDVDDRDQAWVDRKRKGRKSDALLSCPACFSTLCIDCQRHETIVTQYRAMFVMNCKILKDKETQSCVQKPSRKSAKTYSQRKKDQDSTKFNETFQLVSCAVCETEVAVIDDNEVYHFYNVLPSYV